MNSFAKPRRPTLSDSSMWRLVASSAFLKTVTGHCTWVFRTLGLGADHYTGPELMTDFSWYFREPFSAHYTYSSMAQTYGFINNHEFGLQLHRQNMSFGLSYRWLDILGVHFRTLSFGAGINF